MTEDHEAPEIMELRARLAEADGQLAEAEGRAQTAIAEGARLTAELAAATDAASSYETDVASMRAMLDDAAQREREAAVRYRDLIMRSEPALPPDLITGDTIEAVDASVATAREIAGRVRSHIESQAQVARVPAGAPQRSAPDLSALSPDEKIKYGLAQRAQA